MAVNKDNTESEVLEWELPLRGMIDSSETTADSFQFSLRPTCLREYIGQDSVKENLALSINAAKRRGEPLDHVLLHGPPGLGKTTLAAIIAAELGVQFKATSGPVLERPGDLAAVLSSLSKGDVLFIDEIHRLHRTVEEILYPAMEDYQIDVLIGQGAAARSVKLSLQPFTLVGATTRTGMVSGPLRDRFGIIERLEFYTPEQLALIIDRSASLLGIPVVEGGLRELSRRSRGTPRIANRLLKRTRDVAQELADSIITDAVAALSLERLDIDSLGLDKMDRAVLRTIIEKFDGGPVGVETLAAALHEDRDTIEDVYEPFLMQLGFLQRTPRGREATARAFSYFGYQRSSATVHSPDLFSYKDRMPDEDE